MRIVRHLLEALACIQRAQHQLDLARLAIGPIHGTESIWHDFFGLKSRLEQIAANVRCAATDNTLALAASHSAETCEHCSGPESTGERRGGAQ